MAKHLKKVQVGSPLEVPAQTFNTFIDAARDFQERSQDRGGKRQGGSRLAGLVLVKNTSGSDCNRFDVLGIDGVVFSPTTYPDSFKDRVVLDGKTPATADHTGKFVILAEPIANGEIGHACIDGVCPVKIDITDTDHAYADIDNGDSGNLNSGTSGAAQILWAESGTGEKWAIVRLGSPSNSTAMFAVQVTQTGGSAGDSTTLCTYTYTVKDVNGITTLGTAKAPKKWRNASAKRKMLKPTDGSIGKAYYDATGTLQLFDANEVFDVTEC